MNDFQELKSIGFEEAKRSTDFTPHGYHGCRYSGKVLQFTSGLAPKMMEKSTWWRVFVDSAKLRVKLVPSHETHPDSRKINQYKHYIAKNNKTGERDFKSTFCINCTLNLPKGRYVVDEENEDGDIIFTLAD